MIKVEYLSVYNFQAAVRGMRNPMNSWEKSDSVFDIERWCHYGEGYNCLDELVLL